MKKILVFILLVALIIPALSYAKRTPRYKAVEVTNGGTIKGTIKSENRVDDPVIPIRVKPKGDPEETRLEEDTCGSSQQAMMYVLSPDNEVKNALVIVEGITHGRAAPKKDITINNLRCRFEPLVSIAYVKSYYIIRNSDPLLHNTWLGKVLNAGARRTIFNLALPYRDQVIKKPNRVAGLINVRCDIHPWMRAYVYSSRHPYAAITDAGGNFEIRDIPPGTYKIRVWHEGFEDIIKEVKVKPDSTSDFRAVFTNTRRPFFMK